MFRPPPTIIEIGTDEDIQQVEEAMHQRAPDSPIALTSARLVFDSPETLPKKAPNGLITPPLSLSSSFNDSPM